MAFTALDLSLTSKYNSRMPEVLEVFMMIYMLGGNFSASSPSAVRHARDAFGRQVKDWSEVKDWMTSIQKKLYPDETTFLDFEAAGRVVEEIGASYGDYNRKECGSLKNALLDVESQKAGRVRLSDFYKKGLNGVFSFNEKVDYLRVLGAIDESDPLQPHVIIPNYVASRPNCMVASSFYVICCRNECEDLMAKLENAIGAEMSTPEQVLLLTGGLSTDTVEAPRSLSASLIQRLHSIADSSGGQVPLHGRLFAQWMHHAFPRECPYPHTDKTNPQTPDEWMRETGQDTASASREEIMAHVTQDSAAARKPTGEAARKHHHFEENELPWSEAEELLLPLRVQPRGLLHKLAIFAVMFSMVSGVVWTSTSSLLYEGGFAQATKGGSGDIFKDAGKLA